LWNRARSPLDVHSACPGDAYLCIVPAPRSPDPFDGVSLPFEGDQLLAIILSKAMLLANDTKITDPAITRQIHGS
jgi:hypothetical protein